jgi:hypothetical protein
MAFSTGAAQGPGSVVLRAGLTFSPRVSGTLEGGVGVWRSVSVVASARGVWTGLGCIGIDTRTPCTPDGLSLGMGARVTSAAYRDWLLHAESAAGAHLASSKSVRPFLEGTAGIGRSLGSRLSFEFGASVKRIWVSSSHHDHVLGGAFARVGLRVR